ncbi:hypothetical protein VNO78_30820 [Psophocarpus tetragonolobus]|uniref:Uncharacterized protein n=1 Tax=Psophocarpus tetragonolobus TaxID=3891 RepID=A0AAN9X845_PSOTE
MDGEMFGKKEMDEILSFRKVVDWAIMSESASDMGATPLHSFASLVDQAIGSIKVIAEANLRASPCPVHDFASAVDIRTKNSVEPKAAVNNFAGGGTIDGSGVTIRRSQSWPKGKTEIMFDFDFCLSNVSSSAGYRCTCEKFMSDLNSLSNVGSSARYGCSFKERYDESPYHPHAFQFHDIPETLMGSGTIEGEGCPKKQPNDTFTKVTTGKKAISFDRDEENRNLATYFLRSLKEDRLFEVFQIGILDEENKQEIKEVAILAAKCLSLIGQERPRMKEVELELERISLMKKYHSINIDKNVFETQYLFHEESFKVYELEDSGNHQYA